MTSNSAPDDSYVAALLLKDAEASKKWSGLPASISQKRRPDAPKPNTTFLRNIIRSTDSHNAALKAREADESAARLRGLGAAQQQQQPERKRRRLERDDPSARDDKKSRTGERDGRWQAALSGLGAAARLRQEHKPRSRREDRDVPRPSRGSRERRRDTSREQRDRSPRKHRHSRGERARSRSRSPERASKARSRRAPSARRSRSRSPADRESDSDTLEDLVGPRPPPQSLPRGRGRGATSVSDMDSRFAAAYDPKTDVGLDDGGDRDDWDMALEAVRDRAKWKAQGGERLRAAGFSEEEVRKWERGGEKDVEDVRWRKKGESREWDRGKVVDDDGVKIKVFSS